MGEPTVLTGTGKAGLNTVHWDRRNQEPWDISKHLVPGIYTAVLTVDGKEYTQTITAESAPDEVIAGLPNTY